MAKVYDVPADILISKIAEVLKNEDIQTPSWVPFVKTGSHADKPPQISGWWHIRCASIFRKIYLNGPITVNDLRSKYGTGKAVGYGRARHRYAGGAIIRNVIHDIGYNKSEYQFDAQSCGIFSALHSQSSDINQGVV